MSDKVKKTKRKADKGSRGYRVLHWFLAGIIRLLFRVRATGVENIPEKGGAILCSNHIAIRDVVLLAAAIDRQPRFLAKAELFRVPVLSALIRALGAMPLDRGGKDVGAVKGAIALAKNGSLVTVFPQGHRYPGVNPADTPIKNGAGMIAYHAGVPMIPVCIKVKKEKYGFLRRVNIIVGKPMTLAEVGLSAGGRDEYRAASEAVFDAICALGGYERTATLSSSEGEAET